MSDELFVAIISASRVRSLVEKGWLPESALVQGGVDGDWADVVSRLEEKYGASAEGKSWILID